MKGNDNDKKSSLEDSFGDGRSAGGDSVICTNGRLLINSKCPSYIKKNKSLNI